MASESILKELFKVSVNSDYFKGLSNDEIWKACLSYKDRTDEDIRIAMDNIKKKDAQLHEKSEEHVKHIEESKIKMDELRKKEDSDRQKDEATAENLLENFFNT